MAEQQNVQNQMLDALLELVRWTKVTSIPQAKKVLEDTLVTDEQKRAYQSSDGATLKEIAEVSGASRSSIGEWWTKWHRAGLGELRPVRGGNRFVRAFDLEDFGIQVPESEKEKGNVSHDEYEHHKD